MIRRGVGALVAAALAASLAAGAPPPPSRDGPIPGFSGGFGEATCQACHFEGELNESPGSLELAGVPERYVPGRAYPITLTLTRPRMVVGGFQLTARFEEGGTQAGSLATARADGGVTVTPDRGVQYAHHLRPGSELTAPDTARWTVLWTAPPERGAGGVLVHVAANAGDGDDSQLGDRIYAAAASSRPEPRPE